VKVIKYLENCDGRRQGEEDKGRLESDEVKRVKFSIDLWKNSSQNP
jgi:hypothetical protein